MKPFGQYTRAALVVGALCTSGALSAAASREPAPVAIAAPITAPIAITRSFVTAHVGDTITNRLTTSTDTVAVSLPRPPGLPSRIWVPRCGATRIFARHWIGTTIVSAETTFVTVTGTASECASAPRLTQTQVSLLATMTNACDSALVLIGYNGGISTDSSSLPVACKR